MYSIYIYIYIYIYHGIGAGGWDNSSVNYIYRFYQNVKRLSNIMKADPQSPMDKAILLLEYIVKTDGAEHLKIASRKQNIFCLNSIDVIICYLTILAVSYFYVIRPVILKVRNYHVISTIV